MHPQRHEDTISKPIEFRCSIASTAVCSKFMMNFGLVDFARRALRARPPILKINSYFLAYSTES